MSNTKKEIMSLRLDVKVIFNLQVRIMCIAWDSTRSHMFGVCGVKVSMFTPRKDPTFCTRVNVQDVS
jgi:hypothetical protein